MENPKRGELTITLGQKKYKARVTMDVVMRIERSMGMGIIKVAQQLSEADISTEQTGQFPTPPAMLIPMEQAVPSIPKIVHISCSLVQLTFVEDFTWPTMTEVVGIRLASTHRQI